MAASAVSIRTAPCRHEPAKLYMKGPLDVWDAQGKKVEGVKQMEEVLRRAKTPPHRP
jgi:hypothetical protein